MPADSSSYRQRLADGARTLEGSRTIADRITASQTPSQTHAQQRCEPLHGMPSPATRLALQELARRRTASTTEDYRQRADELRRMDATREL